ncbi:MAG: VOC family protein [Bacillota bacterium]
MKENKLGEIRMADLTVSNALELRDFYKEVIGWKHQDLSMGEYNDYVMQTAEGEPTAGICHRAGGNADLPPVWLVYFCVEDLASSLETCKKLGGKVLSGPKGKGSYSYAVIEDPSGTICALSQL